MANSADALGEVRGEKPSALAEDSIAKTSASDARRPNAMRRASVASSLCVARFQAASAERASDATRLYEESAAPVFSATTPLAAMANMRCGSIQRRVLAAPAEGVLNQCPGSEQSIAV